MKSAALRFLLVNALAFGYAVGASGSDLRGEASLEGRIFENDHKSFTDDHNLSAFVRFEKSKKMYPWRLNLRVSARADAEDERRSMLNPEEIWVGYQKKGWDIRLGTQMLDWTATEAFHPADTFNSRMWDSDIENADKIGELALSISKNVKRGEASIYYMPRYEEPIFPSKSSRLNTFGAGVKVDDAIWIGRDGDVSGTTGHQWGLRATQSIGGVDLSMHYLSHQDRSHPVVFQTDENNRVPVYLPVDEFGITYQQVFDGVIAKLEYANKDFDSSSNLLNIPGVEEGRAVSQLDHGQLALGFEYGWSLESGSEMTLYMEGQRILGVDSAEASVLSLFQNDVMFGYRFAFNDIKGRELFFSLIIDQEYTDDRLYNLRFQQRITDTFTSTFGLRYIQGSSDSDSRSGLIALDGSNQFFVVIARYF